MIGAAAAKIPRCLRIRVRSKPSCNRNDTRPKAAGACAKKGKNILWIIQTLQTFVALVSFRLKSGAARFLVYQKFIIVEYNKLLNLTVSVSMKISNRRSYFRSISFMLPTWLYALIVFHICQLINDVFNLINTFYFFFHSKHY